MAEAEEFLTGSVDDYLLSLADGIYQAQKALSQLRVETMPGQPPTTYYLPKVEFELKLSFELERRPTSGMGPRAAGDKLLVARTITPMETGAADMRAQAASTIRGSFVAVPADGGKPSPVITTSLVELAPREIAVTARVTTTIDDPVAGIEVQFNIDRDASAMLNERAGLSAGLKDGTELSDGVVLSDVAGRAVSVLMLDEQEPAGSHVYVTVDALGMTESIVYRVGI